jgi:hypothetical protein
MRNLTAACNTLCSILLARKEARFGFARQSDRIMAAQNHAKKGEP